MPLGRSPYPVERSAASERPRAKRRGSGVGGSAGVKGFVSPVELARAAFRAGFGQKPKGPEISLGPLTWTGTNAAVFPENREPADRAQLVTAVAIALAEHRGKVQLDAVSATRDLGAWQINEPTWVEGGPRFDRERLLSDLDYNAQAAFYVFKNGRRGFGEWSTHPALSSLYRRRAANAVKKMGILEPDQERIGGNVATDIDEAVDFSVDGIMEAAWPVLLKTAVAGTGLALMGWGIAGLFSSGPAGEAVTKAAPVAAEVAKR